MVHDGQTCTSRAGHSCRPSWKPISTQQKCYADPSAIISQYLPMKENIPSLIHWFIHTLHDHSCMHPCMHACIHPSIHPYLPTCLPAYLPTCLPACLPAYLPTYLPTYLTYLLTYVHRYVRTCMHACISHRHTCTSYYDSVIYIYIYIY